MWASLAAATTAVTTAVAEQAAAAGAAAQSAVTQIAEGFEKEGLAMRQKEEADEQALRDAQHRQEHEQEQEAIDARQREVELQLPWVVDGVPDESLRAIILKLSESVQSFLEPLPIEMNSNADFAFNDAGKVEVNMKLLEIDPVLASQRTKLVRRRTTSSTVTEDIFWQRYWFHIGVAQESYRLRQSLSHLANKRNNSSAGPEGSTEDRALGIKLDMELDSDPEDDIVEFVSASQSQPLGTGSDEGDVIHCTQESGGSDGESGDDLDNDMAAEEEADPILVAPPLPGSRNIADTGAEDLGKDDGDFFGGFEDLGDELDELRLSAGEDAGFNELDELKDLGAEVEDLLATDDF